MSLGSWYGGDAEVELELWGDLIDPSFLPSASDDEIAEREEEHLGSDGYQDVQEATDEEATSPAELTELADLLTRLSPEDVEAIMRFALEKLDEQE